MATAVEHKVTGFALIMAAYCISTVLILAAYAGGWDLIAWVGDATGLGLNSVFFLMIPSIWIAALVCGLIVRYKKWRLQ